VGRWFVIPLVAAGAIWQASAAGTEGQQAAVWKTQEVTLTYEGFTTHYSCEGLRDKVEQALLTLGARHDLIVTPYGCSRVGMPEPLPSLQIKVATLRPAAATATAGGDTVEATWKTVSLAGISGLDSGDCELADQIRRDILPLFTTRNIVARTACAAHQQSAGTPALTLDVLVPATH